MKKAKYLTQLAALQQQLVQLQLAVQQQGLKVVVLFEGRDAAGKGGAIKAITECLNPRVCRVVALGKPTEKERSQWYFQRYVAQLPSAGEIVLFDRSWYNRAGVEPVMGFCSEHEHQEFLRTCPAFEDMLQHSGIILLKYWFSVSSAEQYRRFQQRIANPLKQWKFSPMDREAILRWPAYSQAKDLMLSHTDTEQSPWYHIDADDKRQARLTCIRHLLSQVPQQPKPVTIPPLPPPYQGQETRTQHEIRWLLKADETRAD